MIKEIAYGLAGNFIFSLMLFGYKRYGQTNTLKCICFPHGKIMRALFCPYHHVHYDEIIKRLILIETQLKPINIETQLKPINNDNINKKYF